MNSAKDYIKQYGGIMVRYYALIADKMGAHLNNATT